MKTKSPIAKAAHPNTLAGRFRTVYAARLLSLLLLLALPAVVQAQFNYITNNGTITIVRYTGSGGAVTIPDTINGLPVTSITNSAFSLCDRLTSVTIPDSVTSIGDSAFASCFGLTNVSLGNGVINIGTNVFQNCPSLTAITVGPNNPVYSSVAGVLFNQNQTTLIQYPEGIAGDYIVPNSVTNIGNYAFYDCIHLGCVTIGNNVTSIGEYAFAECTSVMLVYFQGNAPSADSTVFSGDYILEVCYQPWTTGWGATFEGFTTALWIQFAYTTNNGAITITHHTSYIGDVFIPDAIYGLPVTSIGNSAFFNYHSMTRSVAIGNNVTNIGAFAFDGCPMTSLSIGNSVTSIGDSAFKYCQYLTSVMIPNGVTSIGNYAFDYAGLKIVTIGNCVANIGNYAFSGCPLTSIIVPNSVTNIGVSAFDTCTSLSSVMIGNGVTSIGDSAFSNCSSLTGIYFHGNAPSVDLTVFSGDNNATAYYLPGTTGWSDFSDNTSLPTVLWNPQAQTDDASFGMQTNQLGFNITGSSNLVIVVEACRTWPILSGLRLGPTRSTLSLAPMVRPISAIQTGRIIPAGSTVSARRDRRGGFYEPLTHRMPLENGDSCNSPLRGEIVLSQYRSEAPHQCADSIWKQISNLFADGERLADEFAHAVITPRVGCERQRLELLEVNQSVGQHGFLGFHVHHLANELRVQPQFECVDQPAFHNQGKLLHIRRIHPGAFLGRQAALREFVNIPAGNHSEVIRLLHVIL